MAIFPKPIIHNKFLFFWLQYSKERLVNKYTQGGQPNFSGKLVNSFYIPIPVLAEQTKIAEILSTWDRAIEKTQQLIDAKQRLKKGLMQQLLTGRMRFPEYKVNWRVTRIAKISAFIRNGISYDINAISGKPISRIETISNGVIDLNSTGILAEDEIDPSYKIEPGDILYSHINSLAHIGKVAILRKKVELYYGMNLLLIRTNPNQINPFFLFYLFQSEIGKKIAFRLAKRAVNQCSINTSEIKDVQIKIPMLEEQEKIVDILEVINTSIEKLNIKTNILEKQKMGMMQKLLTGEVRVKL